VDGLRVHRLVRGRRQHSRTEGRPVNSDLAARVTGQNRLGLRRASNDLT
jgi:hypothetical protein